jgi:hypothetical protein
MAREIDYQKLLNSVSKKMLIFSSYADVCQAAYDECTKFTKPIGVWGETTKDLPKLVKKFTNDPGSDTLVTTYKSMGTGVPVIAANLTIFIDVPFRMYTYTQAINRTHRQGQDSPCKLIQLTLNTGEEPNINSRNIDILEWSKEMVEHITSKEVHVDIKKTSGEDNKSDAELEVLAAISAYHKSSGITDVLMANGKKVTDDIVEWLSWK